MKSKKWKHLYSEIIRLYDSGLSPTDIGKKYNCGRTTIKNIIIRNHKLRSQSDASKLACKNGKKDKAITALIKAAKSTNRFNPLKSHKGFNHPGAKPLFSKRRHRSSEGFIYRQIKVRDTGRWMFEHRYVMEKFLGRKINKKEIVHHKNGNTLDNNISNLQLLTHSQHSTLHGKDRYKKGLLKKFSNSLPVGKWTHKYKKCIKCGTDKVRHASKGLCFICYDYKRRNL